MRAQLRKAGLPGPAGPKGDPGSKGDAGPQGEVGRAGTARAYAYVTGLGANRKIVAARTKGITGVELSNPNGGFHESGVSCVVLDPGLGLDVLDGLRRSDARPRRGREARLRAGDALQRASRIDGHGLGAGRIEVRTFGYSSGTLLAEDVPFTIVVP